eukprot:248479-Pyramimonas_sp.AAC.3
MRPTRDGSWREQRSACEQERCTFKIRLAAGTTGRASGCGVYYLAARRYCGRASDKKLDPWQFGPRRAERRGRPLRQRRDHLVPEASASTSSSTDDDIQNYILLFIQSIPTRLN